MRLILNFYELDNNLCRHAGSQGWPGEAGGGAVRCITFHCVSQRFTMLFRVEDMGRETKYCFSVYLPARYIKYIQMKAEEMGVSQSAYVRYMIMSQLRREVEGENDNGG